jgi:hypothetical protein
LQAEWVLLTLQAGALEKFKHGRQLVALSASLARQYADGAQLSAVQKKLTKLEEQYGIQDDGLSPEDQHEGLMALKKRHMDRWVGSVLWIADVVL